MPLRVFWRFFEWRFFCVELRDFGCWKGVVLVWNRCVELRGSVWNWGVLFRESLLNSLSIVLFNKLFLTQLRFKAEIIDFSVPKRVRNFSPCPLTSGCNRNYGGCKAPLTTYLINNLRPTIFRSVNKLNRSRFRIFRFQNKLIFQEPK